MAPGPHSQKTSPCLVTRLRLFAAHPQIRRQTDAFSLPFRYTCPMSVMGNVPFPAPSPCVLSSPSLGGTTRRAGLACAGATNKTAPLQACPCHAVPERSRKQTPAHSFWEESREALWLLLHSSRGMIPSLREQTSTGRRCSFSACTSYLLP
jgi:hypothetical protein